MTAASRTHAQSTETSTVHAVALTYSSSHSRCYGQLSCNIQTDSVTQFNPTICHHFIRSTANNVERLRKKIAKHVIWTGRMLWIVVDTGWWSGWWVGECFFWYQLTWVVRTKGCKTVVVVVLLLTMLWFASETRIQKSNNPIMADLPIQIHHWKHLRLTVNSVGFSTENLFN